MGGWCRGCGCSLLRISRETAGTASPRDLSLLRRRAPDGTNPRLDETMETFEKHRELLTQRGPAAKFT